MRWLLLLVGILSNAGASLLVKKAVTAPRSMPTLQEPVAALFNWPFWLGLGLYGAAFLVYAAALTSLPINVAHPILTSGAIAAVAVGSVVFYREPLSGATVVGILLVVIGVTIISTQSE